VVFPTVVSQFFLFLYWKQCSNYQLTSVAVKQQVAPDCPEAGCYSAPPEYSARKQRITMTLTIYHNPRCSKSRKTLEIISESGTPHEIVSYLDEMPDSAILLMIVKQLDLRVADLLRRGESEFKDATDLPDLDDDVALAAWLTQHPIVLERPIVVDSESGRAVLGRPPENVQALLPG
jgi:arsenate reductase